jgi:pimeloyl-ACP methyl ester carboxylesterase
VNDISIASGELTLAASLYGAPHAPPVLLLHGISNSRDVWYDWAVRLADRFHVVTLDFRGHGHSARSRDYCIRHYAEDAAAALEFIGRPTYVVGHSLGGVVAGVLAQQPHPLLRAALLVDPAWYFGDPVEFARTVYPVRFTALIAAVDALRAAGAPLSRWIEMVGKTPHPAGGTFAERMSYRQIVSHASALQRQDRRCWSVPAHDTFSGIDMDAPFRAPVTLIRADSRLGAAFLDDHEQRIRRGNPDLAVLHYEGSDHFPQRTHAFADRFGADLESFLNPG